MPEAASRGRIRIEAGDREALRLLGEARPVQLGRDVPTRDARVSELHVERLPVFDVVALERERSDLRQQLIWVRCDGALKRHGQPPIEKHLPSCSAYGWSTLIAGEGAGCCRTQRHLAE